MEEYEEAKAKFEELYNGGKALYDNGRLYIESEAGKVKKPWYKSKTIWINLVALSVVVFQAFGLGQEDIAMIEAAAIPVINLFLRAITKEPIA